MDASLKDVRLRSVANFIALQHFEERNRQIKNEVLVKIDSFERSP